MANMEKYKDGTSSRGVKLGCCHLHTELFVASWRRSVQRQYIITDRSHNSESEGHW